MPFDPVAGARELLELWNSALGSEFPLDARLLSQQLSLDTDPRECFAIRVKGGALAGAVLVKRAARPGASGAVPATGYISFIVTAPGLRRRGLGGALLDEAFSWLTEHGVASVSLGGDRYHFFPGRPIYDGEGSEALKRLAASRGFEPVGMEYDLISDRFPAFKAASGQAGSEAGSRFEYGPMRPGEFKAFAAFMDDFFPGRWADDMAEAAAAGMSLDELRLARDSTDGSIAGFARICDASSAVLAPSVYWRAAMGRSPGGLGPIGVDPSKRGLGVGLELLKSCVDELRARDVGSIAVDWTDLVDFYGKIGFKVWKRYETTIAKPIKARR